MPNFYVWPTTYSTFMRQNRKIRARTTLEEYYKLLIKCTKNVAVENMIEARNEHGLYVMESRLYEAGRPYCKIYPGVVGPLSRTDLRIQRKSVVMPFSAFEIRLPEGDRTIVDPEGNPLRSMLFGHLEDVMGFLPDDIAVIGDGRRTAFVLECDFGKTTKIDSGDVVPSPSFLSMPIEDDDVVADRIGAPYHVHEGDSGFPDETVRACMSLAISTAMFMSGQHSMLFPDIPKRFMKKYRESMLKGEGKDGEAQRLWERAKRMGHHGWTVGNEIELPRPEVQLQEKSDSVDSGRHLQFGHVRTAHVRWQPYGPKENRRYELILIESVRVRPDLPMQPAHPGYKIRADGLV